MFRFAAMATLVLLALPALASDRLEGISIEAPRRIAIGAGISTPLLNDWSSYQVVDVFPRKTAASTLTFLEQVAEEMPFPIQRIQTDRGQECFAYRVLEE